ncbi:12931_t:CDS:2 [Acaulospora morrowiae]|uniref:12931_t:CDS:1 n=1 Tax=Acaulospora morrowiae TaxID=94023 RepID=A0A9N9BU21_9GLOM|nr:12931_t:CDS:2 [Acaulospora morrowiae]
MRELGPKEHRISIDHEKILPPVGKSEVSSDSENFPHNGKRATRVVDSPKLDPREHRISIGCLSPRKIEKLPHNGKKITRVVCSPNMKYIATANLDDRSVCVWKFTDEKELVLDNSFDLKKTCLMEPIRVSDSKNILIGNGCENSLTLEIRGYKTKSMRLLNDQKEGFKGKIDSSGFLKNGELVIVEGDPEKLLILLDMPFVIAQLNLVTQKFEEQYELDWNLIKFRKSIRMKLNSDCTLLAVAGRLNNESKEHGEKSKVYFYLTKPGTTNAYHKVKGSQSFKEIFPDIFESSVAININIMNFIILKEGEFLFVYFEEERTSYIINLCTFSKYKNLVELNLSAEKGFIIPGYIVRFHDRLQSESLSRNRLQIESLSRNIEWEDDMHNEPGKDDKIDLRSYREEIKEIIKDILEKYESNKDMARCLEPKNYDDQLYPWIVEYVKNSTVDLKEYSTVDLKEYSTVDLKEYSTVGPEMQNNEDPEISHGDLLNRYVYDKSFVELHGKELFQELFKMGRVDFNDGNYTKFIIEHISAKARLDLFKGELLHDLIKSKRVDNSRKYYEVSIDKLANYVDELANCVKKLENDSASEPFVSAVKKIVGYEKKVDEKINELDKKFDKIDELDKKVNIDNLSNNFENIDKKIKELDEKFGKIDNLDKKFENIDERFNEIINLIKQGR